MAKRFSFKDMPIGRKLMVGCLFVVGITLTALTGLSVVKEWRDWRQTTTEILSSNARILAADTASAVLFGDRKAATDSLADLQVLPNVKYGGLYDARGTLLATYGDKTAGPARIKPSRGLQAPRFESDRVVLQQPIVFGGDEIGYVYLISDLSALYDDLAGDAAVTFGAAVLAFALASLLFLGMLRGVIRPISQLSEIMRGVSQSGDYAARAREAGNDEVGVLARSFNAMLGVIQDRDAKLAAHQAQLEQAVLQRTAELNVANQQLERELVERKAAQEALHAHDAMLKAVARSAGELLGSLNLDDAISSVLELMGQTLAVGRVQLSMISPDADGRLRSKVQQEWVAPGLPRMVGDPVLKALDLNTDMPGMAASSLLGERSIVRLPGMSERCRRVFEGAGARSLLFIPIMAEGKLWGGLWFVDSASESREWSWAETDTLATLAGLIGVSTTRARYVQELADANRIVQNSPTVLYRLKGEPTMPITYVSQNVAKFGYGPKDFASVEDLIPKAVHADDRARMLAAAAAVMEKDSKESVFEFRLVSPNGVTRWVENRWTPVRDAVGRLVEIEGLFVDITERKAAEEKIALLARTDSLTGLANRATFVDRLHHAFIASKRSGQLFAVLYLDLDHFKDINDTRGHPVGDRLLREVAERLKSRVRETDLIARLGGDEFAVLQSDIADASDAGALAGDLIEVLGAPYVIDDEELRITASVGISPFSPDSGSPDAILSQADLALYRAKEDGRNQYRFHSDDLDRQVSERVSIAEDLLRAIERNELMLYFQPQVELTSGRIVGMEALVRWNHPKRGLLAAADFIPVAERTGAIRPLGRWVLEQACRQMRLWRDEGLAPPVMAVNVSMSELKTGAEFVRQVAEAIQRAGVLPGDIELDVTESMLAQVTLARNDVLEQLSKLGVQIALDDFGGDYSSFDYLRSYRVNHLKVARKFIENATTNPDEAATVRAIMGAARELGIQVIAEGIETDLQRNLLLSIGAATKGQGFYFSEPVGAERATALLREGAIARAGIEAGASAA